METSVNRILKTSLCLYLPFFLACMQIHIPPPELEEAKSIQILGQRPTLTLIFEGNEGIRDKSWVKTLSISRFFHYGIKNQSGSLVELLEPALRKLSQSKGYESKVSISLEDLHPKARKTIRSGDYILVSHLKRHILLWLPPAEFIQSPSSKRRGEVRANFLIQSKLLRYEPKSKAKGAKQNSRLPAKVLWKDTFQKKSSLYAFPGNEKEILEILAHETLGDYVQSLSEKIPPAHSL